MCQKIINKMAGIQLNVPSQNFDGFGPPRSDVITWYPIRYCPNVAEPISCLDKCGFWKHWKGYHFMTLPLGGTILSSFSLGTLIFYIHRTVTCYSFLLHKFRMSSSWRNGFIHSFTWAVKGTLNSVWPQCYSKHGLLYHHEVIEKSML